MIRSRGIIAKNILPGDHLGSYFCFVRDHRRLCTFVRGTGALVAMGFSGPYESFGLWGTTNLLEPA